MTPSEIKSFLEGDGAMIGNAPTAGESSSAYGCKIIKELCEVLNIDITIESAGRGMGTLVNLSIPFKLS